MAHEISGIPFQYICKIIPELDENGMPKECMPQSDYKNKSNIHLHEYGKGPFCRFKVPDICNKNSGVYVILVDGVSKYVGECESLRRRFNIGYGNISPRNCYKGGQQTNCRINTLILETYKNKSRIELLFYETEDRVDIERTLINKLNPEWNMTKGKLSRERLPQNVIKCGQFTNKKRRGSMSKYDRFEQYLRNSEKQIETLSYDDIEKILGFKLPSSAYVHQPWWANGGGHSQANSWLNAGWEVVSVDLGKSITFRKV